MNQTIILSDFIDKVCVHSSDYYVYMLNKLARHRLTHSIHMDINVWLLFFGLFGHSCLMFLECTVELKKEICIQRIVNKNGRLKLLKCVQGAYPILLEECCQSLTFSDSPVITMESLYIEWRFFWRYSCFFVGRWNHQVPCYPKVHVVQHLNLKSAEVCV